MDASRYLDLKKKNAVRLMKLGKGHFALGIQKFDPNSGAELEPELARVTREEIETHQKFYEEAVASCKQMLADMDAEA